MSMQVSAMKREFRFGGAKLPDPNPQIDVEQVRAIYATQFPEIATASLTGPEAIGDKLVYRFERAIGSKG
jgi:PRTRC genetic system protein C